MNLVVLVKASGCNDKREMNLVVLVKASGCNDKRQDETTVLRTRNEERDACGCDCVHIRACMSACNRHQTKYRLERLVPRERRYSVAW
jgi:hypothetical protein